MSDDYDTPKDLVNRVPLVEESPPSTPTVSTFASSAGWAARDNLSALRDAFRLRGGFGVAEGSCVRMPSSASSSSKMSSNNGEFFLELHYSDPRDSKLYTEPGADPEGQTIYKLYVGGEYYYCRPYNPNYYQAVRHVHKAGAPLKLPETTVDNASVYEDVNSDSNNNVGNDCVTIISVSHVRHASSASGVSNVDDPASGTGAGSETSSDRGSFTINSISRSHGNKCTCGTKSKNSSDDAIRERIYENLEFHRVKISVPGSCKKHRLLLHDVSKKQGDNPVSTRIVRRPRMGKIGNGSQSGRSIIVQDRVKDNSKVEDENKKRFEKFGYSKNEVWNWLYKENDEDEDEDEAVDVNPNSVIHAHNSTIRNLYSVPNKKESSAENGKVSVVVNSDCAIGLDQQGEDRTVEVQFSPQEFFSASSRLAHLDLDGLEDFVGNTLEKAIAKRRLKEKREKEVTITRVPEHSLDVRTVMPDGEATKNIVNGHRDDGDEGGGVNNGSRTCQTCMASGESSCSSALSSLESSSGSARSSASARSGCSETLGSELVQSSANNNNNDNNPPMERPCGPRRNQIMESTGYLRPLPSQAQQAGGAPPVKPQRQRRVLPQIRGPTTLSMAPSRPSPSLTSSSRRNCNGSNNNPNNKPYQTLEVSADSTAWDNHNELYDDRPGYSSSDVYDDGCSPRYIPMFPSAKAVFIDPQVPLDRQEWFHGSITRIEAETVLRMHREGSYLVRNSESSKQDFSLSVKSSKGFMHMRIQRDPASDRFILGQFSKPFASVPEMIHHYTLNRLPVKGAEHMCLIRPICEQLL